MRHWFFFLVAGSTLALDVGAQQPVTDAGTSTKDDRAHRAALEARLRDLTAEIASLQQQADQGQSFAIKFIGELDHRWSALPECGSRGLEDRLRKELASAGVPLGSSDLESLVSAMRRGGEAAMAVALYITMTIASAEPKQPSISTLLDALGQKPTDGGVQTPGDLLQRRLGGTLFSLSPAEIAQAVAKGSRAGEYFSSLFRTQKTERLSAIVSKIQTRKVEHATITAQLAAR